MMPPFVSMLQHRELRPHIRFAHYTTDPMRVPERYTLDHEFIYIASGSGMIYTERGEFPYQPDDLLLIPPGTPHSFQDTDESAQQHAHWAIHFDWERMERLQDMLLRVVGSQEGPLQKMRRGMPERGPSLWLPDMLLLRASPASTKLRGLIQTTIAAYNTSDSLRMLELQTAFLQVVLELATIIRSQPGAIIRLTNLMERQHRVHPERSDITRYILNLHEAAEAEPQSDGLIPPWEDVVFFSTAHFHRLFKEQTGCSPHDYYTRLRMDKAARLLLGSSLSVHEIALRCGYEDAKYFSRLFRRTEGVSPAKFRQAYAVKPLAGAAHKE